MGLFLAVRLHSKHLKCKLYIKKALYADAIAVAMLGTLILKRERHTQGRSTELSTLWVSARVNAELHKRSVLYYRCRRIAMQLLIANQKCVCTRNFPVKRFWVTKALGKVHKNSNPASFVLFFRYLNWQWPQICLFIFVSSPLTVLQILSDLLFSSSNEILTTASCHINLGLIYEHLVLKCKLFWDHRLLFNTAL